MDWLVLLATSAAIVFAGTMLARQGAAIADRTPLGQVWVGALLVAAVTSLPELMTDSIAVIRDAPELATGDLLGSNMANMAILGGIAVAFPTARVLAREAVGLVLAAAVAILMTGTAVLFIVARIEQSIAGAFSLGSVALAATWCAALVLMPAYREAVMEGEPVSDDISHLSIWRPVVTFAIATVIIVAAAPFLVISAEDIAESTGVGQTFVGVMMLAVATSLPELSTSIAAVRAGDLDLAVGNLFGSNAINMLFLVWLDLLYLEAPLLESANPSNAVAGTAAILLMMIGLTEMALRTQRARTRFDATGALMLGVYAICLLMVASVSARSA